MDTFETQSFDDGFIRIAPTPICLATGKHSACFEFACEKVRNGTDLLLDLDAIEGASKHLLDPLMALADMAEQYSTLFAVVIPDREARDSLYTLSVRGHTPIYSSMSSALLGFGADAATLHH